jgi:hypothetical protein
MKTAQKMKIIPVLLLLWSLPMSTLPRTVAKPRATATPATMPANRSPIEVECNRELRKVAVKF